ncbi:hypothetical protein PIB30_102051 [Stylosanthes scabra]|uniref:Uncharacterized protein n=1 Tax=Stylosanthes scabra TaxID=79078 RepID=A0ABU6UWI8_9FABA|nr:hypothetical protein [Stylosanthes scabra]
MRPYTESTTVYGWCIIILRNWRSALGGAAKERLCRVVIAVYRGVIWGEKYDVGFGGDELQNFTDQQIDNPNCEGEDSIEEDSLVEVEAAKAV